MTDYLNFKTDLSNPEIADTFEDATYWSSMFGQLLFRHLPLRPHMAVLDVGCGTGFPLLELADRLGPNSTVHGIDSWEQAVERARSKARVRGNANVHVTHGDAKHMPYDDAYFDLIVSNLGVNNFDEPDAVMTECRRVCKPEGHIALTTNLVGHMSEFYQAFVQTLMDLGHEPLLERLRSHEAHRATEARLRKLFSNARFEVTEYHTETFTLRYADGSAFFRAYLSRIGFLNGWKSVLGKPDLEVKVFAEIEARLNQAAEDNQGVRVTIPAAYIEGRRT